ncbi:M24 family metallopeptidase [Halovenus marina]|uniref:M24 family metallopeptidase n=1 Tax=Halovenus marina TaxID=3396621 RepID=UPI003F543F18
MDPDLSPLSDHLRETGVDGYLVHAASDVPDQYYLSGFDAPDPFVTLYDGDVHLLFLRSLEYGRATREARASTISRGSAFGLAEKIDEHGSEEAGDRVLAAFLDEHGVESVATPPRFPLRVADGLREQGVTVRADDDSAVEGVRATKTGEEIDHIRTAQRANEAAMARAEELIAEASVDGEGRLHEDGEVLTSERVKSEIELTLLKRGCSLDDTIVACGADAADPHDRGSGPLLANEAIVVDIFPKHKTNRYFADMTRTFCHGDPSDQIQEWYALTLRAQEAALDAIEPGVYASEVHGAVCDVYENAGVPTLRSDETTETGFIHSTGHGLGLAIHEQPSVATNDDPLEPGHVVTVEPGVYDPDVGGVRIEDLVVITEDGFENLTEYEKELTV